MPRLPITCFALLGAIVSCAIGACDSDGDRTGQAGSGGGVPQPDDAGPEADASDSGQDSSPRPASMFGARCKGDGDCGEGLFCSPPFSTDWIGGGPAHGYCTKDCSQEGDNACTSIDPGSFCHGPTDGVRLCIQGCSPGGERSQLDFDIMKCWARQDVACSKLASQGATDGVWGCWPTCGDDTDCPASACDRGTGLCASGLAPGLPLGSNCSTWFDTQGDAGQRCQGYCTDWTREDGGTSGIHTCLARCVIGDPNACGFPKGMCIESGEPVVSFGDQGYCAQACESDDDCLDQVNGLFCDRESVPGTGVCNWLASPSKPDAG